MYSGGTKNTTVPYPNSVVCSHMVAIGFSLTTVRYSLSKDGFGFSLVKDG